MRAIVGAVALFLLGGSDMGDHEYCIIYADCKLCPCNAYCEYLYQWEQANRKTKDKEKVKDNG